MVSVMTAGRKKLATENNPWERRSTMNAKRQKNIAVIACVLILFVTLASLFYIAKEENHQCTGTDCPICACVHQAEQIVKHAGTAAVYIVDACLGFARKTVLFTVGCLCILSMTLVSQKVRLDS